MWFFLIKSIVGAILGQATNSLFKKTKMGVWFYAKVDSWYKWAAKRYDIDILTNEEKAIKKFPILSARIEKLELEAFERSLSLSEIYNSIFSDSYPMYSARMKYLPNGISLTW